MKVLNKETGKAEEVDDSSLPELVTSGSVQIPERDYEFTSQDGEKYAVPAQEFAEAVKSGWQYKTEATKKEEGLEKKYGDSTGKALLYGGARGLTLGLSDLALTKTGLVSPEELSEVKARNSEASLAGDVLGTAIPALFTGGASVAAEASAAAVARSSLAKKILASSPSALLAKAAETSGKIAAQNIKSTVARGAAELGAAGAIEGAVLGVGQTISEASIGDAQFNAQALLSNVGTGALAGGAFGGALGGGIEYAKKATRGIGKKFRKHSAKYIDDPVMRKNVESKIADEDAMEEAILAAKDPEMTDLKGEASDAVNDFDSELDAREESLMGLKDPEVMRLKAEYPDAPISKGMESAYKPVKQAENYLFDAPSAAGEEIRKTADDIANYTENTVNDIFRGAKEASPEEAGNLIRQSMMQNINEPWQSGKGFYDDFMDELGDLPVADSYRTRLSNEITSSDAFRIGAEGADIKRVLGIVDDKAKLLSQHDDELLALGLNKRQIADYRKAGGVTKKLNNELNEMGINLSEFNSAIGRHAKDLPKKNLSLRQIKELQSDIGAAIRTSKGSERKLLQQSYDRLRTMMDSIVKDSVKGKKGADKIIKGLDAANRDYVRAYEAKDEIAELLGVKGKDFNEVLDKLEGSSAIDLVGKFLNVKKSDKAFQVMQKYPELGKLAVAVKQNELINKHITQKGVNYAGIKKDLLKMSPETRAIYFNNDKQAEKKLLDILSLYEKRPQTLNPSGTDIRNEIRNLLSPKEIFKNWAFSTIYRGSDSELGKYVTKTIPTLAAVEQAANKTKGKITSSVNQFFKSSGGVPRDAVEAIPDKKLDKAMKTYEKVQGNPQEVLDTFEKNNKDLVNAAPETYNALQASLIAGIQFLQSKTPRVDEDYMIENRKPSRSEMIKFGDYVEAIETPGVIYNQIAHGYVNPNTVEAMKVVYPKILQGLTAEVMAKKPKNISRAQAGEIFKLTGIRTTPAWDYDKMMILQGQTPESQVAEQQVQSQMEPIRAAGAKDIKRSQSTMTGLDRALHRA